MEKVNLAIVEDDIHLCEILVLYIKNLYSDQINIIGVANNGNDGAEIIKKEKPDIALIDVIMPSSDGINLLENLNKDDLTDSVCCIMLTAVGSAEVAKKAMELGARYYFMKPYDIEKLIKRVLDIYKGTKLNSILNPPVRNKINKLNMDTNNVEIENLEKYSKEYIHKILNQNPRKFAAMAIDFIGIPPNLSGYNFLKFAIEEAINDPTMLNGLTKKLYPLIGREFNSSGIKVERSIRNCIKVTWDKYGGERYDKFLDRPMDKMNLRPTNGLFIMELSTYYINSRL